MTYVALGFLGLFTVIIIEVLCDYARIPAWRSQVLSWFRRLIP